MSNQASALINRIKKLIQTFIRNIKKVLNRILLLDWIKGRNGLLYILKGLAALVALAFVISISWYGAGIFAESQSQQINLFTGITSVFLSFSITYIYLSIAKSERIQASFIEKQTDLQESVQEFQKRQTSILEAQHKPKLVELQYNFTPSSYGERYPDFEKYTYTGTISNEGTGLAQNIYLGFDIYVDESSVEVLEGCQIMDSPDRSGDSIKSVFDMKFTSSEYAKPRLAWNVNKFTTPFQIVNEPAKLNTGLSEAESGLEHLETNFLSIIRPDMPPTLHQSTFRFKIKCMEEKNTYRLCELPEVLDVLRNIGFSKAYPWVGVEYLNINESIINDTLHTYTIDLKPHYTEQPFCEWGSYPDDSIVYSRIRKIRKENPCHPEIH